MKSFAGRWAAILVLPLTLASLARSGSLGDMQHEIQNILESSGGSVVQVVSYHDLRGNAANESARVVSGVVWDAHHVVTYDPALAHAERVEIAWPDGNRVSALFLGDDPISRVSVLRTETRLPRPLPRRSFAARRAEVILILSNPAGDQPAAALGLVGGRPPNTLRSRGTNWMLITAPIGPGDAGGAVVDIAGELVGIVAGKLPAAGSGELSVAIPLARARRGLERLIAVGGKSGYGYLGVTAEDCPDPAPCVHVSEVAQGGPAFEAGLLPGDEILSVNGATVLSVDGLLEQVVYSPVGARMRVMTRRAGVLRELEVVLRQRKQVLVPPVPAASRPGALAVQGAKGSRGQSDPIFPPQKEAAGPELQTLTEQLTVLEREIEELRAVLETCGWELSERP